MQFNRKSTFKLFGRFLLERNVITQEDIFNARSLQRKSNRKTGEIAMELGYMTEQQVDRVLTMQEENDFNFGLISVEWHYLTQNQLDDVLSKQQDEHIFLGDALLQIGAISRETFIRELKAYNIEKIMYLQEKGRN